MLSLVIIYFNKSQLFRFFCLGSLNSKVISIQVTNCLIFEDLIESNVYICVPKDVSIYYADFTITTRKNEESIKL